MEKQEPVTPAGRLFLQEEMNTVINCVIGLKHPIDEYTIKTEMKNSIMLQHARFRSVLVKDKEGREYWETRNGLNIDKHIFLVKDIEKIYGQGDDCKNDDTTLVNSYLADLSVSTPLDISKPLWELHLLKEQKCVILRVHHALGDVISLMSLFLAMCKKVDHPDQLPSIPTSSSKKDNNKSTSKSSMGKKVRKLLMTIWCTMVYAMELLLRTLFVKDAETKLSGGSGVELWPRKAATARFRMDDMKSVKNAMANTTINDVLFGVVSAGLSRYLDYHKPSNSKLQEGLRITGLGMVNLRKQPGLQDMSELVKNKPLSSWWGNKFGFILLPIYHHKNVDNDPLQYAAMLLNYRVVCNTSFTISNVVGPQEEIMFGGNPVTSFRVTSTSLPHALTMHMVSYAGNAELQILVAKDIIPDPEFLAKCFEDALLEMKDVCTASLYT
ncbi:O-acyltransferase WSD1-like isoform X2 [Papaver somniferum]|uniref:O-acyltransferase WSD1-like isoform X2 n=1 Tax=Papaver somniferum TaxID=3469 RepID=UPI000E6FA802|nr:O-acyltransferase WSD1-like isoform X2 [Papaver somniferum]